MLRPDRAPPPFRTAYVSVKTGKVLQGCPFAYTCFGFGHGFTSSIPSHRPALARRAVGWESLAVTLTTAKISMQPPLFGKAVSGRFYGRMSFKRRWIEFAGAAFISKAVPTNPPQGSYIRAWDAPATFRNLFLSCIAKRCIPPFLRPYYPNKRR